MDKNTRAKAMERLYLEQERIYRHLIQRDPELQKKLTIQRQRLAEEETRRQADQDRR